MANRVSQKVNVVIMGAAGRDFHNFNVVFRTNPDYDLPFFEPDVEIVLVDPHRAGPERGYFPGEVNLLRADLVIITKVDTADPQMVEAVRRASIAANPRAKILEAAMPISVEDPALVAGQRVLVVEDGPTLTHGGMAYGAGVIAAKRHGAVALVDPRPAAVGSLRQIFQSNPRMDCVLPAMGYGPEQIRDLEQTINRVDCDVVLIATPVDLRRLISIRQPACRVSYECELRDGAVLNDLLAAALRKGTGG